MKTLTLDDNLKFPDSKEEDKFLEIFRVVREDTFWLRMRGFERNSYDPSAVARVLYAEIYL